MAGNATAARELAVGSARDRQTEHTAPSVIEGVPWQYSQTTRSLGPAGVGSGHALLQAPVIAPDDRLHDFLRQTVFQLQHAERNYLARDER